MGYLVDRAATKLDNKFVVVNSLVGAGLDIPGIHLEDGWPVDEGIKESIGH